MANKFKLSPPWITFYHDIEAMFKQDPDVKLDYNEDEQIISLYVEGQEKADALMKIMPTEKTFGNVTVRIRVIPANVEQEPLYSLYEKAFKGNPILAGVQKAEGTGALFDVTYVVFAKEVVQYFNDDMSSVFGLRSTLYQDIAAEIFDGIHDGVFFCTDDGNSVKR